MTKWILVFGVLALLVSLPALWNDLPWEYTITVVEKHCKNAGGCDAIHVAYQLGRLDLVAVMLGGLALVIGLSAVFGFLHIKESSERIAEKTAKEMIPKEVRKILNEIRPEITGELESQILLFVKDYYNNQESSSIVNDDYNYGEAQEGPEVKK